MQILCPYSIEFRLVEYAFVPKTVSFAVKHLL